MSYLQSHRAISYADPDSDSPDEYGGVGVAYEREFDEFEHHDGGLGARVQVKNKRGDWIDHWQSWKNGVRTLRPFDHKKFEKAKQETRDRRPKPGYQYHPDGRHLYITKGEAKGTGYAHASRVYDNRMVAANHYSKMAHGKHGHGGNGGKGGNRVVVVHAGGRGKSATRKGKKAKKTSHHDIITKLSNIIKAIGTIRREKDATTLQPVKPFPESLGQSPYNLTEWADNLAELKADYEKDPSEKFPHKPRGLAWPLFLDETRPAFTGLDAAKFESFFKWANKTRSTLTKFLTKIKTYKDDITGHIDMVRKIAAENDIPLDSGEFMTMAELALRLTTRTENPAIKVTSGAQLEHLLPYVIQHKIGKMEGGSFIVVPDDVVDALARSSVFAPQNIADAFLLHVGTKGIKQAISKAKQLVSAEAHAQDGGDGEYGGGGGGGGEDAVAAARKGAEDRAHRQATRVVREVSSTHYDIPGAPSLVSMRYR